MNAMLETIQGMGLIPVIKVDDAADAVPLCRALADGGLPIAEITFRSQAALEAMARVSQALPHMLMGAGTVTSIPLAQKAREAGASFIVTPGFNPEVVGWCLEQGLPILPGCTTASEVEAAQNLGLEVVKFFPAEQSGGLARIKALGGPYPGMAFIPTGGISLNNICQYLAWPKVMACGGSFMVNETLTASKNWAEVSAVTRQAQNQRQGLVLEEVILPQNHPAAGLLPGLGAGSAGCLTYSAPSLTRVRHQLERKGLEFAPQEPGCTHCDSLRLARPMGGFDICFRRRKNS